MIQKLCFVIFINKQFCSSKVKTNTLVHLTLRQVFSKKLSKFDARSSSSGNILDDI